MTDQAIVIASLRKKATSDGRSFFEGLIGTIAASPCAQREAITREPVYRLLLDVDPAARFALDDWNDEQDRRIMRWIKRESRTAVAGKPSGRRGQPSR